MIFENPIFTEMILPFLLVFVVIFAILQKSHVLGENKHQIDAFVALAIALLLIGVPTPRNIIVGIMPWLAVGISVILVFMLLYGFVAGEMKGGLGSGLKITFGILSGIFVIGVLIYITGVWKYIENFSVESDILATGFFLAIIIGAVIWVVVGTKNSPTGDKGKGKKAGEPEQ